jgi:hypothetical protein
MSKDGKSGAFGGRLWSGSDKDRREPERQPEQQRRSADNTGAGEAAESDDFVIHPMHPDRAYQAFCMARRPERLHIDRAIQPSRFLAYHYLVDMNFDAALESVTFPDCGKPSSIFLSML